MTLANLLAIQRLLAFSATPQGVQRQLAAATRNLADARLTQLNAESRFDARYKCIMQCATLGQPLACSPHGGQGQSRD